MNRKAVAKELASVAKLLVTARRCPYHDIILPILQKLGRADIEPRLIEGYLRLEYGTLDHLARWQFAKLMPGLVATVDADPNAAERLAKSYGL